MIKRFRQSSIQVLAFLFFSGIADISTANPVKERFLNILTEHGLSNSTVKSMVMDKEGFLWVATDDGLNRFDGYTIEQIHYHSIDSNGLAHRGINQLLRDTNDNIWVLTKGPFLQMLNTEDFTLTTVFDGYFEGNKVSIEKIVEENNRLWLLSNSHGLLNIDIDSYTVKKVQINSGFSFDAITAIFRSEDEIWITNDQGQLIIYEVASGLYTSIDLSKYFGDNKEVRAIYKDDYHVYLGTLSDGLLIFNEDFELLWEMKRGSGIHDLTSNMIADIEKDHLGRIWVASTIRGINIIDPETFMVKQIVKESIPYSISGEGITDIYKDDHENIWVSTYINGFNLWLGKEQKFVHLNLKKEWKGQNAPAIVEDSEGNIWVANGGDLSKVSPDYNQVIDYANLPDDPLRIHNKKVRYLAIDSRDNLVLGTRHHGVYIKNKNNSIKKILDHSTSINNIQVDKYDNILIATTDGLLVYHPSTEKVDVYNNSINARVNIGYNEVNFAIADENNHYWLGLNNNNVLQLNPANGTYTSYPLSFDYGEEVDIVCLLLDKQTIWAGSSNSGLLRLNRLTGESFNYTTTNGLPGNKIKSIETDNQDNLWVSCDNGIFRLDTSQDKIDHFSISDGLQGLNFITNASYQGKSGKIYFGGYRGFNVFYPDSIKKNYYVPPVRLTQVLINDNKASTIQLKVDGEINPELKYNQKNVTFSFSSFNYNRSSSVIYTYILDGIDMQWSTISHQENINYRNLPPGTYTFRVKSMLRGSDIESIPAKFSFRIKNSPWKAPWAIATYLLIIGGVLFLSRKVTLDRVKLKNHHKIKEVEAEKIKEIDKLKTEFYTNLSHELKTPLTLIISPLQRMFDENDFLLDQKKISEMKMMLENAERLQKLINQIIDLAKIQEKGMVLSYHYDNIIQSVRKLIDNFFFKAQEQKIKLNFHSFYQNSWCYFDKEVLEKVIFNLLSNSLKHTPPGGAIDIRLFIAKGTEKSPQYVGIIVSDTGSGMEQSVLEKIFVRYFHQNISRNWSKSDGIGLSLVKKLIEMHRGTIKVKSKVDQGTTVIFTIPVHSNVLSHTGIVTSIPEKNEISEENIEQLNNEERPLILIAEDDVDLLEYLVENLKNSYHIVAVSNGEAAYQQALEKIPDLIISDMMMPKMTGSTLLEKLKYNLLTNHIPFIMLTGKTNTSTQIDMLQIGADDFVSKPFNFLLLRSKIASLLKNREQLRKKYLQDDVNPYIKKDEKASDFMVSLNTILEKNYKNHEFGVEQIEKGLNMSHVQLYRKLKAVTNVSANTLLRNYRLKKARKLLTEGNFNISQVAYEVGFNDPAYFTRCFSKMEGVSPREFIEKHLSS